MGRLSITVKRNIRKIFVMTIKIEGVWVFAAIVGGSLAVAGTHVLDEPIKWVILFAALIGGFHLANWIDRPEIEDED